MKIIINKDKLTIEGELEINSGAVQYYEVDVEFDSSWDGLTKKAVIVNSQEDIGQEISIINNRIFLDLEKQGVYYLGFVGYTISDEVKTYQISTELKDIIINHGSGEIETEEHVIPSANEWEIYIAQIQAMCNQSYTKNETDELLEGKVDKEEGKELSTNDFTNEYKEKIDNNTTNNHTHSNKALLDNTTASYTTEEETKLAGLENYDDTEVKEDIEDLQENKVDKVNGKSLIDDTEIERLSNVDNYDDTEVKEDIEDLQENKVDKEEGKGLSTNDLTNILKDKYDNAYQLALLCNIAKGYENYNTLITELNSALNNVYLVGQSFLIQTLEVPDLWIYSIEETSVHYTYIDDTTIINELTTNGYFQVGYYKLSMLETIKQDLTNYVKNTDYASLGNAGVVKINDNIGIGISGSKFLYIIKATIADILAKTDNYKPLVSSSINSVFDVQFLKGIIAPTTETVASFIGQLYVNTTNNTVYQCTAIDNETPNYNWIQLIKATDSISNLTEDTTHRTVTDEEKQSWNTQSIAGLPLIFDKTIIDGDVTDANGICLTFDSPKKIVRVYVEFPDVRDGYLYLATGERAGQRFNLCGMSLPTNTKYVSFIRFGNKIPLQLSSSSTSLGNEVAKNTLMNFPAKNYSGDYFDESNGFNTITISTYTFILPIGTNIKVYGL